MTVPGATYPYGLGGVSAPSYGLGGVSAAPISSQAQHAYLQAQQAQAQQQAQHVSVTSTSPGLQQQQTMAQLNNPKRGHRECKECYWWDRQNAMKDKGYCWHKVPHMLFQNPQLTVSDDWCSFYEPAKQTILSPKWQELLKEKKAL